MSELPTALREWHQELAHITPGLVEALGPFLRRITDLVGPFPHYREEILGEPDGYAGLTRRGPYDRLLISEWLFAEEIPDEFFRRAINGEHLFHQLRIRNPSATKCSLLWFDAGPFQLGAPRIAHIAALILFYRRARKSNADFYWGILQSPEKLFDTVDATGIRTLMESRSVDVADPNLLDRWRKSMGTLSEDDDVWLVGSRHLLDFVNEERFSLLAISESAEEERLDLEAHRRREHAPRRARLPLPPPDVRVSLLRNPVRRARLNDRQGIGHRPENPITDQWGRWVFSRQSDDSILCVDLRKKGIRSQVLEADGRTVACGVWGQHIVRVIRRDGMLYVQSYQGKHLRSELDIGRADIPEQEIALQPLYCWPRNQRMMYIGEDQHGYGFRYSLDSINKTNTEFTEALLCAPFEEGLFWMIEDEKGVHGFMRVGPYTPNKLITVDSDQIPLTSHSLLYTPGRGHTTLLSCMNVDQEFLVYRFIPVSSLSNRSPYSPSDALPGPTFLPLNQIPVIGIPVGPMEFGTEIKLISLSEDRHQVMVVEADAYKSILTGDEVITHAVIGINQKVAILTENNILKVINAQNGDTLFEYGQADI